METAGAMETDSMETDAMETDTSVVRKDREICFVLFHKFVKEVSISRHVSHAK